jgi:hypothetical protein
MPAFETQIFCLEKLINNKKHTWYKQRQIPFIVMLPADHN